MDERTTEIYVGELSTQCEFALNAIHGLGNVLSRLFDRNSDRTAEVDATLQAEIFRTIHSFLTHTSNVSLLLWAAPSARPREGETKQQALDRAAASRQRGVDLRHLLAVTPSEGHVLQNREIRNHLEHFDERLDDWAKTSQRRNIVQDFLGSPDAISGIDPTDFMRCYDPATKHLYFRGEYFDLQEMVTAVSELRKQCLTWLDDRRSRHRSPVKKV